LVNLGMKQTRLSPCSDALHELGLVGDDYWLCFSKSDDLPDAPASFGCPCSIPSFYPTFSLSIPMRSTPLTADDLIITVLRMRVLFHREKWPRNEKGQMESALQTKIRCASKHTSHQYVSPPSQPPVTESSLQPKSWRRCLLEYSFLAPMKSGCRNFLRDHEEH
jgi:hypothetical protein